MELNWADLGTVAGGAAFVTVVVGVVKEVAGLVGRAVKVLVLVLSLAVGGGAAAAAAARRYCHNGKVLSRPACTDVQ